MEKEDNAINNIRFYFAHVANGVMYHTFFKGYKYCVKL